MRGFPENALALLGGTSLLLAPIAPLLNADPVVAITSGVILLVSAYIWKLSF